MTIAACENPWRGGCQQVATRIGLLQVANPSACNPDGVQREVLVCEQHADTWHALWGTWPVPADHTPAPPARTQVMRRHWHVGHNLVGQEPEPGREKRVATALDVVVQLGTELTEEARRLAGRGYGHRDRASRARAFADQLEQLLRFFDEDGTPDVADASDTSATTRLLVALDGELSFRVGNQVFWARSCVG